MAKATCMQCQKEFDLLRNFKTFQCCGVTQRVEDRLTKEEDEELHGYLIGCKLEDWIQP